VSRRKTADGGCLESLVLLGLFGLLGFVVLALLSLPYLWTATFYAFPALLVYLAANATKEPRPTLEQMTTAQMKAISEALQANRNACSHEIAAIIERAKREGVRFLDHQDRFEIRSRRGQELNRELEYARSLLSEVEEQIGIAQHPDGLRVLAWAGALGAWYRGRSFRLAFLAALLTAVGVSALWEAYSFVTSKEVMNVLMWNPAPGWIRNGVVFGVQLGWLAGFLTLSILLRYYRRVAMRLSDPSRWGPEDPVFERVISDFEEVISNRDAGIESPKAEGSFDPYKVLGVDRNASTQEIKNAYRDAIKRCHPDTVADRSDSIRDAAEAETQQINNAYAMIRNEREFR
jgi:hypothetical protein